MDLQSLSTRSLVLASLLAAGPRRQAGQPILRYDEALAATLTEPDATIRARARVEILYRAGDLPGALRQAEEGLRISPGDRILLRRALELEIALRLPVSASIHTVELAAAVKRDALDEEARRWWEREATALSEQVDVLREHEAGLVRATARARWVSLAALGTVLAASLALARSAPRRVARDRSTAR